MTQLSEQQVERRKRELEAQFRSAYDPVPVGMAHVDCDGRVLRFNPRFCDIAGRSSDELLGLPVERLMPRDDLHVVSRQALRLLGGEIERASLELRLVRPSGASVAVKLGFSLQRDAAGRPEHFVTVLDELGGHGHGEAALLRLQAGRLRRALDAARMDVFECEPLTGRASRQGPLGRLLGLAQDAAAAEFFALIHPEDQPGFFARHRELGPARPTYTHEFRVRTPEGGCLWLLDQARGQFDEQGRLVRVVGVCSDITWRKEAELALAEERELLQRTLDSIPVMLSLFNPQQQRVTLNRHFETVLGWSTADASDGDFLARLYPDAHERSEVAAFARSSEPGWREWSATAKDGTRIPCEWTRVHLSDQVRLGIGWDLRQRRDSEQRLARLAERQALLLELSSSVLQAGGDEAGLARCVFERIGAHLQADICFNYRADTPSGMLHLVAGFGIPTELLGSLRGQFLCGTVAATAAPLAVDARALARHEKGGLLRRIGGRAYVGHPLLASDGRVLGTFALASIRRDAFAPDEIEFFQTVCQFVALAWKRLHADRELRRREQQHRMALDAGQLGSWRRELLDSHLYHLDERARRHYGFETGDVSVPDLLGRVHPEDLPRLEQAMARTRSRGVCGESSRVEYRVRHPDGSIRWLEVHAKLVFEQRETAPVLVCLGTSADITERKMADAALRESEAGLRVLADSMPQLVWEADAQGTLHYFNRQNRVISGYCREGAGPFQWAEALHPQDRQQTLDSWAQAVRRGEHYEIEHRLLHVDGDYRWHLSRAVPVRDAEGRIARWYGTSTDIHAHRQAELAEQEAAARLRAIVDTAVDGILTIDALGRIDSANPAVERLFGWHAGELLGQPVSLLMPGLGREGGADGGLSWSGAQAPVRVAQELPGRRRDGSLFPIELSLSATPLPGQCIFTALVRDITERRQQQEALQRIAAELAQADRRKDEFLATLAHELRNPLGPLRSAAQLLRFEGVSEAHVAWSGQVVDRQVRHLKRLIDDLLDVSRISHNKLELRRERVALQQIVDGALEGSLPLIEHRQHELSVELPAHEVVLQADPVRLVQVFQNLLDNAAKYTPPGGRIRLSARVEGAEAVVAVQDSGLGISPESRARLFEMFYQAARDPDGACGGLGIGLTLVQRLLRMHGGAIEAHSEGEGRGSTFVVRLPLSGAPVCDEEIILLPGD